jgi:hypothetical protein
MANSLRQRENLVGIIQLPAEHLFARQRIAFPGGQVSCVLI